MPYRLGSLPSRGASAVIRLAARFLIATSRPYHPLGSHRRAGPARPQAEFETRWHYLSSALKTYDAHSFCDLGCAEGHYIRNAAAEGIFAVGVDNDPKRLRLAAAVAMLDDAWSGAFHLTDINPKTIQQLPTFDVIACMSLLHHVIHQRGIDEARALLAAIAKRTGRCMIFDMGGPGEIENSWASSLWMLSGNVDRNIGQLLAEAGFTTIRIVGHTAGYNSTARRAIFIAEPPR